jgi:hypothetical protein
MSADLPNPSRAQKVYYTKNRLLIPILTLVLMGIGIYLAVLDPSNTAWAVLICIIGPAQIALWWPMRIIVTPAELTYHYGLYYSLRTPWKNVARIEAVRLRWPRSPVRCIVLRDEAALTGSAGIAYEIPPDLKRKVIPLNLKWDNLEGLLADVRLFAPQAAG